MAYDKPLPSPNPATLPYWSATREHRLSIPKCEDCGQFHFYPRSHCPHCGSGRLTWQDVSGKGTVFSWTEVFRAPSKAFTGDVPYIVAVVELDEGPHLMSRIVRAAGEEIHVGQKVAVEFEDVAEDLSLPVFRVRT